MASIVPGKPKAVAEITMVAQLMCCGAFRTDMDCTTIVAAADGGQQLGSKAVCDLCGSEYVLGVIAQTVEQSRATEAAAEVFEHLTPEQEEKAGIDRTDFEPSMEDVAMCAACDGDVNRRRDYCVGCKEYVCQADRKRTPGHPSRHAVEEHWEAPKQALVDADAADAADDGSTFDTDDFVHEV